MRSTIHLVACHLAVLAGDGDDAAAVEPLDVRAGQREVYGADFHAGRELGLVDRLTRRGFTVLVTSGTRTSAELLARRLPRGALHQFAPLDAPRYLARFLDHYFDGLPAADRARFERDRAFYASLRILHSVRLLDAIPDFRDRIWSVVTDTLIPAMRG